MRLERVFIAALALSACSTRNDAAGSAFHFPDEMSSERLLFIGAHPDDELGLAPLFADACLDKGATCHFVVTGGGASFGCLLAGTETDPEKCGVIRREEMKKSATQFSAEPEFYGWREKFYAHNADGLARNLTEWAEEAGGHDKLVRRIRKTIDDYRPTLVFALDPRHGSSCHPNHRAVSRLVVEAVGATPADQRPQLWFEQTDLVGSRNEEVAHAVDVFGYSPWPDTRDETLFFDASQTLKSGERAFDYLINTVKAHASQYPGAANGQINFTDDPAMMRVPISRYAGDATTDYCDALALKYPTFDTQEGRAQFGID